MVNPATANRLAVGFVRAFGISYEEAERRLRLLSVRIVADAGTCARAAGQAAVLTAFNTAHRAFLGGVDLQVPAGIPLLLPLRGMKTLDEAVAITACHPTKVQEPSITLFVGAPNSEASPHDILVHADSWRGGTSDVGNPAAFQSGDYDDFCLGGIFAGAAAVHRAFVKVTGLPAQCLDGPFGFSLWDPTSNWLSPVTARRLRNIPTRYWMLGLGHLGQAFIWNLALLPHPDRTGVEFLLNDFDIIEGSNYGSGLLCSAAATGTKKARHCAGWLERQGFQTTISERRFDDKTVRGEDEPAIAFCGFDRPEPRMHLDDAGFGLVIECGLGDSLADFDQARLHVFPNKRKSAREIWAPPARLAVMPTQEVIALFDDGSQECGQLAIDTAGKAVSTSFVGAMAGALAVSELLRTFNHGPRFDRMDFNSRCTADWVTLESTLKMSASTLGAMGSGSL